MTATVVPGGAVVVVGAVAVVVAAAVVVGVAVVPGGAPAADCVGADPARVTECPLRGRLVPELEAEPDVAR